MRVWIAGVFLLLLFFGEQPENSLTLGFIGRGVEKKTVVIYILPTDEPVHAAASPVLEAVPSFRGRSNSIK